MDQHKGYKSSKLFKMSHEKFLTVSEVNAQLDSSMDSVIHGNVIFKITSDKHYKKFHVLSIADGLEKMDQVQLEFEVDVIRDMNKKGKFMFPGSIIKACALKIHKNKLQVTRNTYLTMLMPNQLPPSISANKMEAIPVETARKDLQLKDLVELTESSGISEEIWVKIVDRFSSNKHGGNECFIFKVADSSECMVLKVWRSSHAPLIKNIQVGDYYKFRNLSLKYQEKKKEDGGNEIYLQHVPKYTLFEKMRPEEIAAKFALGDAEFQGSIIAVEGFEWNNICHACPSPTKTTKCKIHLHGQETDIRSYHLLLIGYDGPGLKKEFFAHKEHVDTWRNKEIFLGEDMDDHQVLNTAFDSLLNKPVNIIYNVSQKNEFYTTQINMIETIDKDQQPTKESKKKKKRAVADVEAVAEEIKKAKMNKE